MGKLAEEVVLDRVAFEVGVNVAPAVIALKGVDDTGGTVEVNGLFESVCAAIGQANALRNRSQETMNTSIATKTPRDGKRLRESGRYVETLEVNSVRKGIASSDRKTACSMTAHSAPCQESKAEGSTSHILEWSHGDLGECGANEGGVDGATLGT